MQLSSFLITSLLLSTGIWAINFSELINNPYKSDVTITTKEGETVYAHSILLKFGRSAEILKELLNEEFNPEQSSFKIHLAEVEKRVLLPVIECLYAGESNVSHQLTTRFPMIFYFRYQKLQTI